MTNLEWRPVVGYEKQYLVSNQGSIMSIAKGRGRRYDRLLRIKKSKEGYMRTELHGEPTKNYAVHRLVAAAFVLNPENKPFINHINGIKHDNRVENLEWCTASENLRHAYRLGLTSKVGVLHGRAKLNEIRVINIRHCKGSIKNAELARLYGVSDSLIRAIWQRQIWKHL